MGGDDRGYDEGLLDRLEPWDDIDVADVLERSEDAERDRLAAELARIEEQLEGRDAVHEELVAELERKIDRYTDQLETLYAQMRGRKGGVRKRVKDRIEAFYQELREERRRHWEDRQELEETRRAVLRELSELDDASLSELL